MNSGLLTCSEYEHSIGDSLEEQDQLNELNDEGLFHLTEDAGRSNEVLTAETEMFANYLQRVEPQGGFAPTVSVTPQASKHDLGLLGKGDARLSRARSKCRGSSIGERTTLLSAEQKCDIAHREIEEYHEEIEKLREDSEKILDTYKAIMEEADIRSTEIKKAFYEFERDVVKGAVNARTGKVIAEKFQRYFDDKLRSKDTLIEKLRLKNSTLKVQKKKLILQLKQKEEMGEVLHEVDFNQLKIENQQYIEKIDERNQDLLRLKLMAGNTLQVLNLYKKKLAALTQESEQLKGEIISREELLVKIDGETNHAEEERVKAQQINKKLRAQLAEFKVPQVMDYVQEKAGVYELQKKVKSWERKVEIADMALKTHRKTWQQLRMAKQPTAWQPNGVSAI